jgi:hypothetical protein
MQYSIGTVRGDFYGARATLNVWSPQVESRGEFSLAQIWVLSDDQDLHNTLEAGQGRPKGKAAQARVLGPPKILFFNEGFRPQKISMNFLYIHLGPNLIIVIRVVEMVAC